MYMYIVLFQIHTHTHTHTHSQMMAVGQHASVDKNEDNNHVEEWHMSHDVTLFHITSDMLSFALQGTQLARNMPNHVKYHH